MRERGIGPRSRPRLGRGLPLTDSRMRHPRVERGSRPWRGRVLPLHQCRECCRPDSNRGRLTEDQGCLQLQFCSKLGEGQFRCTPTETFIQWRLVGFQMGAPRVTRSLSFPVGPLPASLQWLLAEFRLVVNKSIRIALRGDFRSRFRLTRAAYGNLSAEHNLYKQYIPSAFEVAIAILKAYRRRVRQGRRTNVPYVRHLMLNAENQSYRLDRVTGKLRIPIRRGEWVEFDLPLSEWHRKIMSDPSWSLGALTLTPTQINISVRRTAPLPYTPEGAIALDTNEASLDGVEICGGTPALVTLPFPEVRIVQATHFRRRRRLARKKAHDRRVLRMLAGREGKRERNRVRQRLHIITRGTRAGGQVLEIGHCARGFVVARRGQPLPSEQSPPFFLASKGDSSSD